MVQITRKEIRRQIFHIAFGIVIALLVYFRILNWITMGLLVIAGAILRHESKKRKIPGIYWFLDKFEREEEMFKNPGKGAFYYLLGCYITLLIFKREIAIPAIIILAIGDSVSHLVGKFGSMRHPFSDKKFLEGMIAGMVAAFVCAAIILNNAITAGLASFFAMVAEGLEIRFMGQKVDDNLLIPVIAGAVIFAVRYVPGF